MKRREFLGSVAAASASAAFAPRALGLQAKDAGAAIVEVNPEKTLLTETVTDLYVGEGAETALPAIVAAARGKRGIP